AVVGDITPGEALGFVEEYFGEWSDPDEPLPPARQLVFRSGPGETLVETLEGRIEAGVVFGCEAPAYGSPDYQAFRMMTSILGGGISSRMGMNLRERQGLTYSVGAYVQSAINASPTAFIAVFMTGAPFASRALEAAQQECALMAAEGVQPEELILRQYMNVGQHSMGFDTYKEVVRYLATRESLGLPLDSDLSNLREILSLDADDIKDVAARYFTGVWFVSAAGGIDENLQPLE
ncbi:MAG: insulinase family protein, partial [Candidatus Fermentibacter daniensis]